MATPDPLPLATKRPSSIRRMWHWLFRERAVAGAGAVHLDVLERTLRAEEAAVTAAAGAARSVEKQVDATRTTLAAAMADGVIDAHEQRALATQLNAAALAAATHTETLQSLTS